MLNRQRVCRLPRRPTTSSSSRQRLASPSETPKVTGEAGSRFHPRPAVPLSTHGSLLITTSLGENYFIDLHQAHFSVVGGGWWRRVGVWRLFWLSMILAWNNQTTLPEASLTSTRPPLPPNCLPSVMHRCRAVCCRPGFWPHLFFSEGSPICLQVSFFFFFKGPYDVKFPLLVYCDNVPVAG